MAELTNARECRDAVELFFIKMATTSAGLEEGVAAKYLGFLVWHLC
ncbi:hypothetical protein [Flavobacterium sp. FlaQc-48]